MRKPRNNNTSWTKEEVYQALEAGSHKAKKTAASLERSPSAVTYLFTVCRAFQRGEVFKEGYGRNKWRYIQEYLKERGEDVALPKLNGLSTAPSEPQPDKEEQVLSDINELVRSFGASLRGKVVDLAQLYMVDERQAYQNRIAELEKQVTDLQTVVGAAKRGNWAQGIKESLLRGRS